MLSGPITILSGTNFDDLLAILLGKKAPLGVGQSMAKSDKGLRAQHVANWRL